MRCDLRAEARRLVLRIVQLGEAVGDLAAGQEELEAIGEERIGIVGARQRRDFRRIGVHEGGVHEGVLGGLLEDLDLQLARAVVRIHGDAELLAHRAQVGHIAQRQRIDAGVVGDERLLDRQPPERLARSYSRP